MEDTLNQPFKSSKCEDWILLLNSTVLRFCQMKRYKRFREKLNKVDLDIVRNLDLISFVRKNRMMSLRMEFTRQ